MPPESDLKRRKPMRAPDLGDSVLYVDPHMAGVYPGIVTRTLPQDRIFLTVFPPDTTPYPVRSFVEHDPAKSRGTWHWRDE